MTAQDDAGPLLQTKLYIPKPRRGQVGRPRLLERLRRGAESKLTLVSAPAGFGKTTLLAEWLDDPAADGRSTAWLSLDPSDSQAASFWPYVIAALQTVAPDVGATALSLLRQPQPPPIELVLAPLVNELSATSHQIVLVLDDYHVDRRARRPSRDGVPAGASAPADTRGDRDPRRSAVAAGAPARAGRAR